MDCASLFSMHLRRMRLAAALHVLLAAAAPLALGGALGLLPASQAVADDDDDDDGGGSASSTGRSGGKASTLELLQRQKPVARPRPKPRRERPRVERHAPPPPVVAPRRQPPVEFVALVDIGLRLETLRAAGFEVLQRETMVLTGTDILRLRSTRRETAEQALRRLRAIAPVRAADRNDLFRTSRADCEGALCESLTLVGWSTGPAACDSEC